jgi:hypothetical protein
MSMNIWWVISQVLPLTEERNYAFELDNTTCIGCIVSLLSDQLCDVYMEYTMVSELWEALDRKYVESDTRHELYVNYQYHIYRMVDDRSIVEQAHDIQLPAGELVHFNYALPDRFVVGGIIVKLPPSWSFATPLKHKGEVMTVENRISTLDVEEKARSKDVPHFGPSDGADPSNANVVEGKSGGNKNKNWKGNAKQNTELKKKSLADLTCFVCGETGHIARKCRNRNGKKGGDQKYVNAIVSESGVSGYEPKILLACQSTDWWLDIRANVYVCSDLNLFSSYQDTDSWSVLMGNGSRAVVHEVGRNDLKLTSKKTLFKECATCFENK